MTSAEFDAQFEAGIDIADSLDMSRAVRPGQVRRRVGVDLPEWMVRAIDGEARRLGVTRRAVITAWLAERLGRRSA